MIHGEREEERERNIKLTVAALERSNLNADERETISNLIMTTQDPYNKVEKGRKKPPRKPAYQRKKNHNTCRIMINPLTPSFKI